MLCASIDGASGLLELIKKLCIKCEKNSKDKMQDCSDKLISNKSNASRNFFDVANELFTGSITTLVMAFSGQLAVDYIIYDVMEYVELLTGWLSMYLRDKLGEWILNQNGWVRGKYIHIATCNWTAILGFQITLR